MGDKRLRLHSKAKKKVEKKTPKPKPEKTKQKPKTKKKTAKPEKPTPAKTKPKPRREIQQPARLVGHPTSMIVFGMKVTEPKIRAAAVDAYRKRVYTTDDIHVIDFLVDQKHDNLMVKIALLDRVQEMVCLLYPNTTVERKNKITLIVD